MTDLDQTVITDITPFDAFAFRGIISEKNFVQLKPELTEDEEEFVKKYKNEGVKKRLIIFYRPLATDGTKLYFKNHRNELIHDSLGFYNAKFVYFTNIPPGEIMEGYTFFEGELTISGKIFVNNSLLMYYPGGSYSVRDEYSMYRMPKNEYFQAEVKY